MIYYQKTESINDSFFFVVNNSLIGLILKRFHKSCRHKKASEQLLKGFLFLG
jgi:hypothetical protein